MKSLFNFLPLLLIFSIVLGISSCEKNILTHGKGTAEFSISLPNEDAKSAFSSDTVTVAYHIMLSIEDINGTVIISDSLIPLYIFGTSFVSENIELKSGQYNLTKFLVINPEGEVVFASPVEGSELAYLVNDPLPMYFKISAETITRVRPEVLYVGSHTPEEFGYASFGMEIIKPLHFWTTCIIAEPAETVKPQYTTAKLTVFAPDGWHYTFRLEAKVNHLIIRGKYSFYYFLIEKEGYTTQKLQFSQRELASSSYDDPLILKIIPGSGELKMLVLQPGTDDGKDAMISNLEPDKNFGDHKYFEATYLSEPVLTVMRSNRSLISFNLNALPKSAVIRKVVLHLSYNIPVPFNQDIFSTATDHSVPTWYGAVLQQITEQWDEHTVTWNKQPKTTEINQVYISPFIRNCNYLDVDVTRLYIPTATFPEDARKNGMLFRLWPIERFPGFRFASGDYPVAEMRPKLIIYYTIN